MLKRSSPTRTLSKLELERRALLMQLGGYEFNGCERLYSRVGKEHLEQVSARKRIAAGAGALQ
jgi:hypothetical protein